MKHDTSSPQNTGTRLSRRAFIKGAGAAAVVAGIPNIRTPGASGAGSEKTDAVDGNGVAERFGPEASSFVLNINGHARQVTVEPRVTLLDVLRDHLGLYGTKLVCDRGACGACTIHLDGVPVVSCMILAVDARGHQITTIEGLGADGPMHPVQRAFVQYDALQCGFCTPGMIMSVAAALSRDPNANLDQIKRAVSGNICRCGTYPHVFNAALAAANGTARDKR